MCLFCENIKQKKFTWQVRSTYADDNICDFVNEVNCDICGGCQMYFKLDGYEYNDNTMVGVTYIQQLTSTDETIVNIMPFSESLQFNFCPFCGKQISKNIKNIEEQYYYIDMKEE